MRHHQILEEFDKYTALFKDPQRHLANQLSQALKEAGLKTHSVSHRLKAREELHRKLSRPDKTYKSLWEVTDLIGLRVTTYFEDSIQEVAKLIENSFNVDFHHTQDRLRYSDFRSFGYRSLHYVCALLPEQCQEMSLPSGFRFEIQVRTILQHAWAEIEHDLGYKASDSTPEAIRRRFTRIAGLLELADEEFVSIRRDLKAYEKSVHTIRQDTASAFPLDRLSLRFIVEGQEVNELDTLIAQKLERPLSQDIFSPEYLLKMLRLAGLRDTAQVQTHMARTRSYLLDMIAPYFEFTRTTWRLSSKDLESVPRGYALFFLSHAVILESSIREQNKIAKLAEFYRELDYPDDEKSAYDVATGLIAALGRAQFPPLARQ